MGIEGQGHPQASATRNMKTVSNLDLRQILALQASHQHQNHQMHLENGANNLLQVISKYQGGSNEGSRGLTLLFLYLSQAKKVRKVPIKKIIIKKRG